MRIHRGRYCMKKYVLLLLTVFVLSACNNDNLEQQEQAVQDKSESDVEEIETKENASNTSNMDSIDTESNENDDVSQDTEQMIGQFIEDMYTENNLEDYRNIDEIVSEEFNQKINEQFSDTVSEEDTPDTEMATKNVDIYKSISNRNDEYVYILDLEIINHDTKNIAKSQHIGKVKMSEESDTLKINSVEELSNKEINE